MKKGIKRLFVLFIFLGSLLFGLDWFQDGTLENIEQGEITYSKELGWVNWSHAIPDRVSKEFKNLQKLSLSNQDSIDFLFSMDMKLGIGIGYLVAATEELVRLPAGRGEDYYKTAFAQLFKSVSIQLEKLQGGNPYRWLSGSRNSSFRNGDLMGNLISLHCGMNNVDFHAVQSDLNSIKIEEAIAKNKMSSIDTNKVKKYPTSFAQFFWLKESLSKTLSMMNDSSIYFRSIKKSNRMSFI